MADASVLRCFGSMAEKVGSRWLLLGGGAISLLLNPPPAAAQLAPEDTSRVQADVGAARGGSLREPRTRPTRGVSFALGPTMFAGDELGDIYLRYSDGSYAAALYSSSEQRTLRVGVGARLEVGLPWSVGAATIRPLLGFEYGSQLPFEHSESFDGVAYQWRIRAHLFSAEVGAEFLFFGEHLGLGPSVGILTVFPVASEPEPGSLELQQRTLVGSQGRFAVNYYFNPGSRVPVGIGAFTRVIFWIPVDFGVGARVFFEWGTR